MSGERRGLPKKDRLYRTAKEERTYRELKEKYGLKNSVAAKSRSDKDDSVATNWAET